MRTLPALALLMATTASADPFCGPDTVRYGTHRQTNFVRVSNVEGDAMGQIYERPAPMMLTGIEASILPANLSSCNPFGTPCTEGGSTFTVRASAYTLDDNDFPDGQPFASVTQEVPCQCGAPTPDQTRVVFPISPNTVIPDDYAVVVFNEEPNSVLYVHTNEPATDDGEGEDRGLYYFDPDGPGEPQWFHGMSISIINNGSHLGDSDVYVHPIVQFTYDDTFTPVTSDGDECIEAGTQVVIDAPLPILESSVYNKLYIDGLPDEVSRFDMGDGTVKVGTSISHTYNQTGAVDVTRTVRYRGWSMAGECQHTEVHSFQDEQPQYFDCDADGVTGADFAMYCGEPIATGAECAEGAPSEFASTDQGDCNDSDPFVYPDAPEECDGIDNDCNLFIDDDIVPVPDDPIFGECADNVVECLGGEWASSPDNYTPLDEACDGLDNDCDGLVDNSIEPVPSDNVVGACASNVDECTAGAFAPSPDNYQPTDDVCDGIDNDCDAATADGADDPELGAPCDGDDADDCETGTYSCVDGGLVCSDDAQDDDCDPDTDTDTEDPDTEGDTDGDSDSDTETEPLDGGSVRCGCASAPGPSALLALPLVGLLVLRRRRV